MFGFLRSVVFGRLFHFLYSELIGTRSIKLRIRGKLFPPAFDLISHSISIPLRFPETKVALIRTSNFEMSKPSTNYDTSNNTSPNHDTGSSSLLASQASMIILSFYSPYFALTIRVLKGSTRFIRKHNLRGVSLHDIFWSFQTFLYVYSYQWRCCHRSHCFSTFSRRWHREDLDIVVSSTRRKISQLVRSELFTYKLRQTTLGNNSWLTFIGPRRSCKIFFDRLVISNYFKYF